VRPLRADGSRYPGYADAIAALDPPALFDNRPSYRLLAAGLTGGAGQLDLSLGRYFDGVNVTEALAHEFAGARPAAPGPAAVAAPGVPGVPFTGEAVRRLADGPAPMQAAGAAVLQLAWRHRGRLLG